MPRGIPKSGTGGQFKAKDDPRRNNAGQRSREVVATSAQARALYVQVLHEDINITPAAGMSNLELIVRLHVQAAKRGDADEREKMFDRIWGKAIQGVSVGGTDGGPLEIILREVTINHADD
jgi:hypothetical protein